MKNLIKTATIFSLLVIVCLMIGACGDDTEQLARNQGDVLVIVKDANGVAVSGATVQERETAVTGTLVNLGNTDLNGQLKFTGTAGDTYYFTVSKTGYVTQTDLSSTPQLTSTVNLNVILQLSP
jgi:hypothetical protein